MSLFNANFDAANKIRTMTAKLLSLTLVSSCLLWAAGCSTVDSRIAKNRDLFNSWPPAVQEKIVVGQIDLPPVRIIEVAVEVRNLAPPAFARRREPLGGVPDLWIAGRQYPRFKHIRPGRGRLDRLGRPGIGATCDCYADPSVAGDPRPCQV